MMQSSISIIFSTVFVLFFVIQSYRGEEVNEIDADYDNKGSLKEDGGTEEGKNKNFDGSIDETYSSGFKPLSSNSEDWKFNCYVCSWSQFRSDPHKNYSNEDLCSSYKFQPEAASIAKCQYGCQTVSYKIHREDNIRNFYRNCLKKDEGGKELEDKCIKINRTHGMEQRCSCLSSLCNSATKIFSKESLIPIFTPLILATSITQLLF